MIKDFLKKFLQPPVILASIIFGALLLGATILMINFSKVPEYPVSRTTADLHVIAGPTSTPTSPPPTKTPAFTPTFTPTATLPPGEYGLGAFVMVEGTGGIGLNIRSAPSLTAEIILLGAETEVFQLMEGPVSEGGYTWWYLVKPGEEERQGWAVEDYLVIINTP